MLEIDGGRLRLEDLAQVGSGTTKVRVAERAWAGVEASRAVIERIVAEGRVVYGVSTGFGKLADVHIPREKLAELQVNLVRSHACGVGEPLAPAETRVAMLLRANVLAKGYSGARREVLQTLVDMLNGDLLPVVPSRGSVGASGDLAPLAHLALGMIGDGDIVFRGERMEATEALARGGVQPVALQAKEGLALLNGTQAMLAVGGLATHRACRLIEIADLAGAMTLEALLGTPAAFDARIHEVRHQAPQVACAERLRRLLEGSQIRESHREGDPRVQDAYCLRCMPQVHGAVAGALDHVRSVLEAETTAATDNPLIFAEQGDVVSGGNFHGAPVALALDYAAIALTDLMSIAERRIDRLVNPDLNEGLPPFLTPEAGCSSGLMIPHVVAVSLLAEAKVLAHPASVDNLPTSGGKEDHVSMGMTSALKLRQIVDLAERVLAIELIAAAQGIEYRRPLRTSEPLETAHRWIRAIVEPLTCDRSLTQDIEAVARRIAELATI